jgi:hypothetical protein
VLAVGAIRVDSQSAALAAAALTGDGLVAQVELPTDLLGAG